MKIEVEEMSEIAGYILAGGKNRRTYIPCRNEFGQGFFIA